MTDRKEYKKNWSEQHLVQTKQNNLLRLKRLQNNPDDKSHGYTGYMLGCRCEKCRDEGLSHIREYRKRRLQYLIDNPDCEAHGTASSYYYGCRCEKCMKAGKQYRDMKRDEKKSEAVG